MIRAAVPIAILSMALLTAACTTSRDNSPPTTSAMTPPPATATQTPTSPAPTDPSNSTPPATSTSTASTIPTPSVTPSAQGAVDAYIAFYNASTVVDRDPQHVSAGSLDSYLTGKAQTLFDGIYADMKSAGQAYRGTPPDPRVRVQTIVAPTVIFLTSCPLASTADPYTEYYVATGKAVPTAKPRDPPPPYLLTLTMKKVGAEWRLSDVLQNTSKTCDG